MRTSLDDTAKKLARELAKEVLPPAKATLVDRLDDRGVAMLALQNLRDTRSKTSAKMSKRAEREAPPMPEMEAQQQAKRDFDAQWAAGFSWSTLPGARS
jgi:enoyl-CoA hydratase/carnithine racemase